MKLKRVGEFQYSQTKKFPQYEDENHNIYIEKETDIMAYTLLRKISEISKNSENLAPISGFYLDKTNNQKLKYLVPKIKGKTLEEIISLKINLDKEEIDNIIYQLCSGLSELHKNGVLHRDIKPANIMITTKNVVMLLDYDISREFGSEKLYDTDASGTHGYAPPEQYGFYQTEPSADIYSLGKTLSRLIENCGYKYRFNYNAMIRKATEFDKKNRYQSVEEILKIIYKKRTIFFKSQAEQITKAKELGLSDKQIEIFAQVKFNSKQMGVIKHSINEKVSKEVLNIIAQEQFSSMQMWQIKAAAIDGLTKKQIEEFAKPYYTENEMFTYRNGIKKQLNTSQIYNEIKKFNDIINENKFSDEQIKKLRQGIHLNLSIEQIRVYAHDFLTIDQMEKIIRILQEKYEN